MEQEKTFAQSFAVPMSIIIAGLLIAGAVLYTGSGRTGSVAALGDPVGDQQPVVVDAEGLPDDDAVLGNPDAPVTIVEFSDFQCPFCRSFFINTYPQLKSDYIDTGIAKLVYRDFPLSFHEAARISAIAGECADEQGRFWDFHDRIYNEQQAINTTGTVTYGAAELKQWARAIGLDGASFDECLDSERYGEEVDADMADGQANGVSGTPSFFVNGTLLVGAQPFATFQQAIEAAR